MTKPKVNHWEIKRRLRDEYNAKLVNLWQGYKANRRPNYCEIYDIVDIDTNEVILHKVTLKAIYKVLFRPELERTMTIEEFEEKLAKE